MKKLRDFFFGFLVFNLLWLLASLLLQSRVLPAPTEVYAHFGDVLSAGILVHIAASMWRIVSGLGLSLAMGVPVGILMARSGRWAGLLGPLVYFSYPIPKTALLPVAMLLFGLGDGSKILIIVLTTVFQVIVSTRDAVHQVDSAVYQVATAAGAGRWAVLRHVTLPAILPALLTALRLSTGTALAILFLVEAYGTRAGIGYYILDAWSRIDYLEMYGAIVVVALLGAVLFLLTDLLSRRLCRWQE